MSEREQMLQRIRMYSFALIDAALFLDGHPREASALAFHNEAKKLYDQAVADYEAKFGPLSLKSADDTKQWRWIEDPWPWEGADN